MYIVDSTRDLPHDIPNLLCFQGWWAIFKKNMVLILTEPEGLTDVYSRLNSSRITPYQCSKMMTVGVDLSSTQRQCFYVEWMRKVF